MIEKKELLKLFRKYRFDSFDKEPFLYATKNKIGIYYTFRDEFYGQLSRVYLPTTLKEADSFLNNYYSYLKQGRRKGLKIILSNYIDPFASPKFDEDIELLDEKLINIDRNFERLYKSATKLIAVLKEKIEISYITYQNVKKLTDQYLQILKKYQEKMNIPAKDSSSTSNSEAINQEEEILNQWEDYLDTCQTKQDILVFINQIVDYLKSLEQEDSFINNKYFMIKIPLEIDLLKKKIAYIEEYEKIKSKRQKKAIDLASELEKIEANHENDKIVNLISFTKHEQERINEKYELITEMDPNTIAEYFIDFDNLTISPRKKPKEVKTISKEENMRICNDYYLNLNEENKTKLRLLTFYQRYIYDYSIDNLLLKDMFSIIQNPINLLAKIKLFKNTELNDINDLATNINKTIHEVDKLTPIILPSDLTVYFESNQNFDKKYIFASTRKDCIAKVTNAPLPVTFKAELKKGSLVYFISEKLTVDVRNDDKLFLKPRVPIFIIDIEKNNVKIENSDIIKVTKIKIDREETTDIITVTKIKQEKISCFANAIIERK